MKIKLQTFLIQLVLQGAIAFCTTYLCFGQIKIPNPSFEFKDTTIGNFAPPLWNICKGSPDLISYPNSNNLPKPVDGINYVELAESPFPWLEYEELGIKLSCKLIPKIKYRMSVDICTHYNYYFDLGKLIVFGSNTYCGETDTLWQSPFLDTAYWQHFSFTFIPTHEVQYLSLGVGAQTNFTCILIDNLSDIYIDSGYTAIQTQSTANTIINGECATLSNRYLIGEEADYHVVWQQNGKTIGTNHSLTVCPSTNTTYYVKATDNCGYYSTDSITIEVTPDNKAYFNVADGKIQLQYSIPENALFKIYNLLGQEEEEKASLSINQHQSEIAVRALIPGLYIACIQNELGKTLWRQKIWINNL